MSNLNFNNLSQAAREAFYDSVNKQISGVEQYATGTPVNAVAATGIITSSNTEVTDGDTVTINGVVYTFKDTMAAAFDVKRNGTTADTTLANLRAAINGTGTPGSEYFAGTTTNADVTCSAVTSHALTLTAKTKGIVGNLITLTKSAAQLTLSGLSSNKLTGGIDGTVAKANTLQVDASYLYIASADNTTADANWRRISLGTAY